MVEGVDPGVRRPAKSATAFRTISEVARELELPQHVLRFWESKFAQIKPLKRGGGRRYYRPEDVLLLRRIRRCLYEDGYTIKGVQRLLREGALRGPGAVTPAERAVPSAPATSAPPTSAPATSAPPRPAPSAELDLALPPRPPPRQAADDVLAQVLRELTEMRDLLRRRRD